MFRSINLTRAVRQMSLDSFDMDKTQETAVRASKAGTTNDGEQSVRKPSLSEQRRDARRVSVFSSTVGLPSSQLKRWSPEERSARESQALSRQPDPADSPPEDTQTEPDADQIPERLSSTDDREPGRRAYNVEDATEREDDRLWQHPACRSAGQCICWTSGEQDRRDARGDTDACGFYAWRGR